MAYAVIAGACLYHWGGHRVVRFIGIAYPVLVAVEVVATGNHFFLDLAAGVAVAGWPLVFVSRVVSERPGREGSLGTRGARWSTAPDPLPKDLPTRVMAKSEV